MEPTIRKILLMAIGSALECVCFAQYSPSSDTTYRSNDSRFLHVDCDSLQKSFKIHSKTTDVVETHIDIGDSKVKYPIITKESSRYIDVLDNRVATKDGESGFKASIGYIKTEALPLPPGVPGEVDYRYPYKVGVGLKVSW